MSNRYGYIYKTTNLINGKIYIGQHVGDVQSETYIGSGLILWQAVRKYGIENFMNEVVEWCYSKDELNKREKYWIDLLDSRNKSIGYNLAKGGHWGSIYRHGEMPQEMRDRISNKLKGHTLSQASIEKMRETRRKNYVYRPMNDDQRRKVSENAKDRLSINKDGVEKRVYQHELQSYLDDGWELGGRKRNRRIFPKRICINNGTENKYMTYEEAAPFIATGEWKYGGKKHRFVPKGKRKYKYKTRCDKGISKKKKDT